MRITAKVYVTLKSTVNAPQGQTIFAGLQSLGFQSIEDVRLGKYIEISLNTENKADAEKQLTRMCEELLANPIIEDFRYQLSTNS